MQETRTKEKMKVRSLFPVSLYLIYIMVKNGLKYSAATTPMPSDSEENVQLSPVDARRKGRSVTKRRCKRYKLEQNIVFIKSIFNE